MSEWFVIGSSQIYGPYSPAQMRELAALGKIVPTSQVRMGRDGKVVLANKVQGLFAPKPQPAKVQVVPDIPEDNISESDYVEDCPTESNVSWQYESTAIMRKRPTTPLDAVWPLISLCVVIVNVFGGIVSGIWLAYLGEWGLIFGGFAASMIMPTAYTIAVLPCIGLMLLLTRLGTPPPKSAALVLGFIGALWTAAILVAWPALVFFAYIKHWEPGLTIPLLLWGYATTMSPLKYMASSEMKAIESDSEVVPILAGLALAMLAYLAFVVVYMIGLSWEYAALIVGVLAIVKALHGTSHLMRASATEWGAEPA